MKKILTVLIVAAVLAGSLVMTGCGLRDAVASTYNTWYKYNKEGGINVPLGTADEENAGEGAYLNNAEVYFYFNESKGLKVAVQSEKKEDIELYGGLVSTSTVIVTGGVKEYPMESFGKGRWAALVASGCITRDSEPKVSSDPEHCLMLTGDADKPTIQWKKFLKRYLINQLLGEDI